MYWLIACAAKSAERERDDGLGAMQAPGEDGAEGSDRRTLADLAGAPLLDRIDAALAEGGALPNRRCPTDVLRCVPGGGCFLPRV